MEICPEKKKSSLSKNKKTHSLYTRFNVQMCAELKVVSIITNTDAQKKMQYIFSIEKLKLYIQ